MMSEIRVEPNHFAHTQRFEIIGPAAKEFLEKKRRWRDESIHHSDGDGMVRQ